MIFEKRTCGIINCINTYVGEKPSVNFQNISKSIQLYFQYVSLVNYLFSCRTFIEWKQFKAFHSYIHVFLIYCLLKKSPPWFNYGYIWWDDQNILLCLREITHLIRLTLFQIFFFSFIPALELRLCFPYPQLYDHLLEAFQIATLLISPSLSFRLEHGFCIILVAFFHFDIPLNLSIFLKFANVQISSIYEQKSGKF